MDGGQQPEARRFLIGAIGISGAVAVALITTGHRVDFGLDWIITRAFISGIDRRLTCEPARILSYGSLQKPRRKLCHRLAWHQAG